MNNSGIVFWQSEILLHQTVLVMSFNYNEDIALRAKKIIMLLLITEKDCHFIHVTFYFAKWRLFDVVTSFFSSFHNVNSNTKMKTLAGSGNCFKTKQYMVLFSIGVHEYNIDLCAFHRTAWCKHSDVHVC